MRTGVPRVRIFKDLVPSANDSLSLIGEKLEILKWSIDRQQ